MAEKILFAWSGGKDSAMALYETQKTRRYEIAALLATVTKGYDRVSMHGVRRSLLRQQAESLGIPLEEVRIPKNSSNKEYEAKMREVLVRYQRQGVSSVVFGDIFLQDVKKYRERNMSRVGMNARFPLWKSDTAGLARKFINSGFKAIVTCVDSNALGKKFVGRQFDARFLSELPPRIDPCGENGEFHSFVYDGPVFKQRVPYKEGRVVLRNSRFYYCDLLPV